MNLEKGGYALRQLPPFDKRTAWKVANPCEQQPPKLRLGTLTNLIYVKEFSHFSTKQKTLVYRMYACYNKDIRYFANKKAC